MNCKDYELQSKELDRRLNNIENLNIDNRLDNLENYQKHCENTHNIHSTKDDIQSISVARHLELINRTISTQDSMALSIKQLSDNISSISKFISDNEQVLELIVSITTGFRGIRKVILGTAAIVTALGIIVGAVLATWSIINAPTILDALILLKTS